MKTILSVVVLATGIFLIKGYLSDRTYDCKRLQYLTTDAAANNYSNLIIDKVAELYTQECK